MTLYVGKSLYLKIDNDKRSMVPRAAYHKKAWGYLLKNHPHDSICGCSVSEVHRDNDYRFRQAKQIANNTIADCLDDLAYNINTDLSGRDGAFVVFNAGQRDIDSVYEVTVPMPIARDASLKLFDCDNNPVDYTTIKIHSEKYTETSFRNHPDFKTNQYITFALPLKVQGFGYTAFSYNIDRVEYPERGDFYMRVYEPSRRTMGSMRTAPDSFDNGIYNIKINPNGTLDITVNKTGKVYENMLMLEESGDNGDGWNYVKPQFGVFVGGFGM